MLELYNTINTVVYIILAYLFLGIFLYNKRINTIQTIIALLVGSVAEIGIVKAFDDVFIIKVISTILIIYAVELVIYRESILKIMLLSILQYFIEMIIEFFAYIVAIKFTGYIHLFDVNQNILSIYGGVISQLLYLMLIIIISFKFRDKTYKQLHPSEFIKFSIFPIISVSLIMVFVYYSTGREISTKEQHFYTYLSICVLVMNVYMFWIMKIDVDKKIEIRKTQLMNEHAADLMELYHQIATEHKEIRSIEHEYKNHLSVINSFCITQKYSELEKYLKTCAISPVYSDVIDTGNPIVTAIFNAKYAEASRIGIQVRFKINSLKELEIKDSDLVIIFSNLFNNAIEACEKFSGQRILDIKILNINNSLFISFTNTTCDSDDISSYIETTKKDTIHHGYGINNIKTIVENLDGHISITNKSGSFSVNIVIPL